MDLIDFQRNNSEWNRRKFDSKPSIPIVPLSRSAVHVENLVKKQWMQSSSYCSSDVSFSPSREPRQSIIVSHLHTSPAFEVLIARTHVTAQQQHGTVTVRI